MHKSLIAIGIVALLAGCSGNTYGTGVSSEKQLVDDISSMVSLGTSDQEKEKINYNSRPTLVKPPQTAALPTPAEQVQAESAYFPEDPESKRQRLLAALAESEENGANTELAPELEQLRAESLARGRQDTRSDVYATMPRNGDGDCIPCEHRILAEGDKQRLAEKTAERLNPTIKKRRYLTQPPTEYQVPAETAAVGQLGDKELSEAAIAKQKQKKNEKSIFDSIFRR